MSLGTSLRHISPGRLHPLTRIRRDIICTRSESKTNESGHLFLTQGPGNFATETGGNPTSSIVINAPRKSKSLHDHINSKPALYQPNRNVKTPPHDRVFKSAVILHVW